jgi:hypothetical protein
MRFVLSILGLLQIAGGIIVYSVAKSAIHEILGSVSFGMGVMAIGLGGVIAVLEKQLAIFDRIGKPKI